MTQIQTIQKNISFDDDGLKMWHTFIGFFSVEFALLGFEFWVRGRGSPSICSPWTSCVSRRSLEGGEEMRFRITGWAFVRARITQNRLASAEKRDTISVRNSCNHPRYVPVMCELLLSGAAVLLRRTHEEDCLLRVWIPELSLLLRFSWFTSAGQVVASVLISDAARRSSQVGGTSIAGLSWMSDSSEGLITRTGVAATLVFPVCTESW